MQTKIYPTNKKYQGIRIKLTSNNGVLLKRHEVPHQEKLCGERSWMDDIHVWHGDECRVAPYIVN